MAYSYHGLLEELGAAAVASFLAALPYQVLQAVKRAAIY